MPSKTPLHPKVNLVSKQNSAKTSSPGLRRVTVQAGAITAMQTVKGKPGSLTQSKVLQLQRTVGNRAVSRLVTERKPGLTVTNTHVAQRALITKEDIFLDQVKIQIVKGIASLQGGKTKYEEHEQFVKALNTFTVINLATLNIGKKSQTAFFQQERSSGLAQVTLANLQNKGLLMEAVKLVDLEADWGEYKTEIKPSSEAEGLGGQAENDNRAIKTRLKWENVHGPTGEGTKATALILGPDHPLGSTPTPKTKVQSTALSKATGLPYIAGHLLNDHLGGPGNEPKNITALPKDVNTEQSDKIEEKVKQKVNAEHEIVFYQVKVTYAQDSKPVAGKKHHYAKEIKSTFGSYKEDADFSKVSFANIPDSELKDRYDHTLPIEAPSEYATSKSGYKQGAGSTSYSTGAPRDAAEQLNKIPKPKAVKLKIEESKEVLLKDTKQVKLEFISFAIYSLPIRDLRARIEELERWSQSQNKLLGEGVQEITRLEEEGQFKDKLLRVGAQEITRLEDELAKSEMLLKKLSIDFERVVQDYKQELEDRESAQQRNKELEDTLGKVQQELMGFTFEVKRLTEEVRRLTAEVKQLTQKLEQVTAQRNQYQEEKRGRAEDMGRLAAQANQPKEKFVREFSPESSRRFHIGYESQREAEEAQRRKEEVARAKRLGYHDGYYLEGYHPPDNRYLIPAYDQGYDQGIYHIGFNHGKQDAERNLTKRYDSRNPDYHRGYDEGYAKYSSYEGQPVRKHHKY